MMMMTDFEIIHLLTVLGGTIAIIVLGGVFIIIRDRQRDNEDEE
jgi:hypothetical protein